MITIGIIGRIGAGKSTVARRFAERGARIVDADAIAHEVLEEPDVQAELVARFGSDVLTGEGHVDRGWLATRVFGPSPVHAAALADLEAIVHPRVHRRIERTLAAVRQAEQRSGGSDTLVVLDVPLLERAGWDAACDHVVKVDCEDTVRRERLARRGISPAQQAAREAAWESTRRGRLPGRSAAAGPENTFAVDTSGDLTYTELQVDRIVDALLGPRRTAGRAVDFGPP
ncbi:MAG: dephospho-CoA kinase [Planctomycetia bacterium]